MLDNGFGNDIRQYDQEITQSIKITFFCISKSNLILFSVTILGDMPFASGIVANTSWKKYRCHYFLEKSQQGGLFETIKRTLEADNNGK